MGSDRLIPPTFPFRLEFIVGRAMIVIALLAADGSAAAHAQMVNVLGAKLANNKSYQIGQWVVSGQTASSIRNTVLLVNS